MRVAVTGSIATDHLMSFSGRFVEQLLPEALDRLSVSFLVDDLRVHRGGVAANIAFGMGRLGLSPLLVGAVGADFDPYREWLEANGVDTSGVHVSSRAHTARFVCTTDTDQNQIASFYPGAMSEAREIELAPLFERSGAVDLVLVAPNDPQAMLRHTRECRASGRPFAADPSQQLAGLDGESIEELIDGADYLFTNAYERALIHTKTGWSPAEVLARVGVQVTTHGADGISVERRGEPVLRVPALPATHAVDPTGVGDAFRAGFLAARAWGLGDERCCQVGAVQATCCLQTTGTQEYQLDRELLLSLLERGYGPAAAAEVAGAELAAAPTAPPA